MKNRKLSARAVVSLMLSAILFCMPIGAFFANRTNTIEVHAEDTAEQKTESASDAENTVTPGNGREENSGTDTGEGKTENSTEAHFSLLILLSKNQLYRRLQILLITFLLLHHNHIIFPTFFNISCTKYDFFNTKYDKT